MIGLWSIVSENKTKIDNEAIWKTRINGQFSTKYAWRLLKGNSKQ